MLKVRITIPLYIVLYIYEVIVSIEGNTLKFFMQYIGILNQVLSLHGFKHHGEGMK